MSEVRTEPVPFTVVAEIGKDSPPGAAEYWPSGHGFNFRCPCGCKAVGGVRIAGAGAWQWDGNREKPTVSPSVLLYADANQGHWHGWLRNGIWESC